MFNTKSTKSTVLTAILAVLLCIAMIPAESFAADIQGNSGEAAVINDSDLAEADGDAEAGDVVFDADLAGEEAAFAGDTSQSSEGQSSSGDVSGSDDGTQTDGNTDPSVDPSAETGTEETAEEPAKKKIRKKTTRVKNWPRNLTLKSGKEKFITIKINVPDHRVMKLQLKNEKGKWQTIKKLRLPKGRTYKKYRFKLPNRRWWRTRKTRWRIVIPKSKHAKSYTSKTLKIKTERRYQNPPGYIKIRNEISNHGYGYYTAPVLVDDTSTRKDHVEALIKTAYKYYGDPFVVCRSGAPGYGVDCSGLVMQACYGAGVDLWPVNPYRHRSPAYEYESRNIAVHPKLKTVPYGSRKRGDLIFYANSSGTVIHVAIYLGGNTIIHSTFGGVQVSGISYRYGYVCKVKRIFN